MARRADAAYERPIGDKIESSHSGKRYEVLDLGILHPNETSTAFLAAGHVGYVGEMAWNRRAQRYRVLTCIWVCAFSVCNMKAASEATVGDTFHKVGDVVEPLPGFKPTKAMVRLLPTIHSSKQLLTIFFFLLSGLRRYLPNRLVRL
jgi:translation elongation factor EF-4